MRDPLTTGTAWRLFLVSLVVLAVFVFLVAGFNAGRDGRNQLAIACQLSENQRDDAVRLASVAQGLDSLAASLGVPWTPVHVTVPEVPAACVSR